MSNHVHLVVIRSREDSLAVLFRRVHGRYAQYLNTRRLRSGHLWQSRFFSCALSASHLWTALRYVEQNPCRALMACDPAAYRWSSAAAHLGLRPDRSKVLDLEFWKQQGAAERWQALHAPENDDRIILLQRSTYSGRLFGDEAFVAQLEDRFGRTWRRWKFEKLAAGAGTWRKGRSRVSTLENRARSHVRLSHLLYHLFHLLYHLLYPTCCTHLLYHLL